MARNEAEQGVALANDTIINIPPPTENRFDQSTAAGDLDAANELSSDEIQPENSLQSAGLQKELSKLWEETEDDNQDTLMENDAKSNDDMVDSDESIHTPKPTEYLLPASRGARDSNIRINASSNETAAVVSNDREQSDGTPTPSPTPPNEPSEDSKLALSRNAHQETEIIEESKVSNDREGSRTATSIERPLKHHMTPSTLAPTGEPDRAPTTGNDQKEDPMDEPYEKGHDVEIKLRFGGYTYIVTLSAKESSSCQEIVDQAHEELVRSHQLVLGEDWIRRSTVLLAKNDTEQGYDSESSRELSISTTMASMASMASMSTLLSQTGTDSQQSLYSGMMGRRGRPTAMPYPPKVAVNFGNKPKTSKPGRFGRKKAKKKQQRSQFQLDDTLNHFVQSLQKREQNNTGTVRLEWKCAPAQIVMRRFCDGTLKEEWVDWNTKTSNKKFVKLLNHNIATDQLWFVGSAKSHTDAPYAVISVDESKSDDDNTFVFDVSGSRGRDGGECSHFMWDFGDGTRTDSTTTSKIEHQFEEFGVFTVKCTVMDFRGNIGTCSMQQVIGRAKGRIDCLSVRSSLFEASPKEMVIFHASNWNIPGLEYRWYFGDGPEPTVSKLPRITHCYDAVGSYSVRVEVSEPHEKDQRALKRSATLQQRICGANRCRYRPAAVIVVDDELNEQQNEQSDDDHLSVTFDASRSVDRTGTLCTAFWFDFGDGSDIVKSDDSRATHRYKTAETYLVTVVAEDKDGKRGTASLVHTIEKVSVTDEIDEERARHSRRISIRGDPRESDHKKGIDLGAASRSTINLQIHSVRPLSTLKQSVSFKVFGFEFDEIIRKNVHYRWDFGDGSDSIESTENTIDHVFEKAGSYSIEVSIVDKKQQQIDEYHTALCTHCVLPYGSMYSNVELRLKKSENVADGTEEKSETEKLAKQSEELTFWCEHGDFHDADTHTRSIYVYDFGDWTAPQIVTNGSDSTEVKHRFDEAGTYQVTVTAIGVDGCKGYTATSVLVVDLNFDNEVMSPQVFVKAIPAADQPKVTFDVSGSVDREGGDLWKFTFDFGDGTDVPPFENQNVIEHDFKNPGIYHVTVIGESNGENTATARLSVKALGKCFTDEKYEDDNPKPTYLMDITSTREPDDYHGLDMRVNLKNTQKSSRLLSLLKRNNVSVGYRLYLEWRSPDYDVMIHLPSTRWKCSWADIADWKCREVLDLTEQFEIMEDAVENSNDRGMATMWHSASKNIDEFKTECPRDHTMNAIIKSIGNITGPLTVNADPEEDTKERDVGDIDNFIDQTVNTLTQSIGRKGTIQLKKRYIPSEIVIYLTSFKKDSDAITFDWNGKSGKKYIKDMTPKEILKESRKHREYDSVGIKSLMKKGFETYLARRCSSSELSELTNPNDDKKYDDIEPERHSLKLSENETMKQLALSLFDRGTRLGQQLYLELRHNLEDIKIVVSYGKWTDELTFYWGDIAHMDCKSILDAIQIELNERNRDGDIPGKERASLWFNEVAAPLEFLADVQFVEFVKSGIYEALQKGNSSRGGLNGPLKLVWKCLPDQIVMRSLYDGTLKEQWFGWNTKNSAKFEKLLPPHSASDQLWFVGSAKSHSDAPYAVIAVEESKSDDENTFIFDVSGSRSSDGEKCSQFIWDFGDGTPKDSTKTPKKEHRFEEYGVFTVKCTVIDNAENIGTCSMQHVIGRGKGLIDSLCVRSSVYEASPKEMVIFHASNWNTPGLEYRWYFGDGPKPTVSKLPRITHCYDAAGSYSVRVEVSEPHEKDQRALKRSATLQQRICGANRHRPAAELVVDRKMCGRSDDDRLSVTFDASRSVDKTGSLCTAFWFDFGDGSDIAESVDPRATHSYETEGKYLVTVVAEDKYGKRGTASLVHTIDKGTGSNEEDGGNTKSKAKKFRNIRKNHHKKEKNANGSAISISGADIHSSIDFHIQSARSLSTLKQPVSFRVFGGDEITGKNVHYRWDFGDGSDPKESTEHTIHHVFKNAGSYSIKVSIVDKKQRQIEEYGTAVCTHCVLPHGDMYPNIELRMRMCEHVADDTEEKSETGKLAKKSQDLTFWCERGDIDNADTQRRPIYVYDFGDWTAPQIVTDGSDSTEIKHRFDTAGTYQVTVTAIGADGCKGYTTASVLVVDPNDYDEEKDPQVFVKAMPAADLPMVVFDVSGSMDREGGDLRKFVFDFGDGTDAEPFEGEEEFNNIQHIFKKPGIYHVTVNGETNGQNTATVHLSVRVLGEVIVDEHDKNNDLKLIREVRRIPTEERHDFHNEDMKVDLDGTPTPLQFINDLKQKNISFDSMTHRLYLEWRPMVNDVVIDMSSNGQPTSWKCSWADIADWKCEEVLSLTEHFGIEERAEKNRGNATLWHKDDVNEFNIEFSRHRKMSALPLLNTTDKDSGSLCLKRRYIPSEIAIDLSSLSKTCKTTFRWNVIKDMDQMKILKHRKMLTSFKSIDVYDLVDKHIKMWLQKKASSSHSNEPKLLENMTIQQFALSLIDKRIRIGKRLHLELRHNLEDIEIMMPSTDNVVLKWGEFISEKCGAILDEIQSRQQLRYGQDGAQLWFNKDDYGIHSSNDYSDPESSSSDDDSMSDDSSDDDTDKQPLTSQLQDVPCDSGKTLLQCVKLLIHENDLELAQLTENLCLEWRQMITGISVIMSYRDKRYFRSWSWKEDGVGEWNASRILKECRDFPLNAGGIPITNFRLKTMDGDKTKWIKWNNGSTLEEFVKQLRAKDVRLEGELVLLWKHLPDKVVIDLPYFGADSSFQMPIKKGWSGVEDMAPTDLMKTYIKKEKRYTTLKLRKDFPSDLWWIWRENEEIQRSKEQLFNPTDDDDLEMEMKYDKSAASSRRQSVDLMMDDEEAYSISRICCNIRVQGIESKNLEQSEFRADQTGASIIECIRVQMQSHSKNAYSRLYFDDESLERRITFPPEMTLNDFVVKETGNQDIGKYNEDEPFQMVYVEIKELLFGDGNDEKEKAFTLSNLTETMEAQGISFEERVLYLEWRPSVTNISVDVSYKGNREIIEFGWPKNEKTDCKSIMNICRNTEEFKKLKIPSDGQGEDGVGIPMLWLKEKGETKKVDTLLKRSVGRSKLKNTITRGQSRGQSNVSENEDDSNTNGPNATGTNGQHVDCIQFEKNMMLHSVINTAYNKKMKIKDQLYLEWRFVPKRVVIKVPFGRKTLRLREPLYDSEDEHAGIYREWNVISKWNCTKIEKHIRNQKEFQTVFNADPKRSDDYNWDLWCIVPEEKEHEVNDRMSGPLKFEPDQTLAEFVLMLRKKGYEPGDKMHLEYRRVPKEMVVDLSYFDVVGESIIVDNIDWSCQEIMDKVKDHLADKYGVAEGAEHKERPFLYVDKDSVLNSENEDKVMAEIKKEKKEQINMKKQKKKERKQQKKKKGKSHTRKRTQMGMTNRPKHLLDPSQDLDLEFEKSQTYDVEDDDKKWRFEVTDDSNASLREFVESLREKGKELQSKMILKWDHNIPKEEKLNVRFELIDATHSARAYTETLSVHRFETHKKLIQRLKGDDKYKEWNEINDLAYKDPISTIFFNSETVGSKASKMVIFEQQQNLQAFFEQLARGMVATEDLGANGSVLTLQYLEGSSSKETVGKANSTGYYCKDCGNFVPRILELTDQKGEKYTYLNPHAILYFSRVDDQDSGWKQYLCRSSRDDNDEQKFLDRSSSSAEHLCQQCLYFSNLEIDTIDDGSQTKNQMLLITNGIVLCPAFWVYFVRPLPERSHIFIAMTVMVLSMLLMTCVFMYAYGHCKTKKEGSDQTRSTSDQIKEEVTKRLPIEEWFQDPYHLVEERYIMYLVGSLFVLNVLHLAELLYLYHTQKWNPAHECLSQLDYPEECNVYLELIGASVIVLLSTLFINVAICRRPDYSNFAEFRASDRQSLKILKEKLRENKQRKNVTFYYKFAIDAMEEVRVSPSPISIPNAKNIGFIVVSLVLTVIAIAVSYMVHPDIIGSLFMATLSTKVVSLALVIFSLVFMVMMSLGVATVVRAVLALMVLVLASSVVMALASDNDIWRNLHSIRRVVSIFFSYFVVVNFLRFFMMTMYRVKAMLYKAYMLMKIPADPMSFIGRSETEKELMVNAKSDVHKEEDKVRYLDTQTRYLDPTFLLAWWDLREHIENYELTYFFELTNPIISLEIMFVLGMFIWLIVMFFQPDYERDLSIFWTEALAKSNVLLILMGFVGTISVVMLYHLYYLMKPYTVQIEHEQWLDDMMLKLEFEATHFCGNDDKKKEEMKERLDLLTMMKDELSRTRTSPKLMGVIELKASRIQAIMSTVVVPIGLVISSSMQRYLKSSDSD